MTVDGCLIGFSLNMVINGCLLPLQEAMRRQAVGIWSCKPCRRTVAGGAYTYTTVAAANVRSFIRRNKDIKEREG